MGRSKVGRTFLIAAFLALAVTLVAHDFLVAAPEGYGTRGVLAMIASYRSHVSPHLRGVVRCRFTPTCSLYGYESVRRYGLIRGGAKAAWRILRCNPWTKQGTVDLP